MTDVSITPEDRERLAKSKFSEWFKEEWDKNFDEAFEKKAGSRQRRERVESSQGQQQQQSQEHQEEEQPKTRRRSLLEECLSQTFGF